MTIEIKDLEYNSLKRLLNNISISAMEAEIMGLVCCAIAAGNKTLKDIIEFCETLVHSDHTLIDKFKVIRYYIEDIEDEAVK